MAGSAPPLDLLKALGDNTRYAIYLELARSPRPLGTGEVAETLGLHVNTVRPHLERMREVGLLEVHTDPQGTVGRPQHRYALAADAPSLGLEPAPSPLLARMLVRAAAAARVMPDDAADAGRDEGRAAATRRGAASRSCIEALRAELARLGFDPAVVVDGDDRHTTIAFTHCPFRELAETHPDIVCNLHRGLVEGFVEATGGAEVDDFRPLVHRDACQVDLVVGAASR